MAEKVRTTMTILGANYDYLKANADDNRSMSQLVDDLIQERRLNKSTLDCIKEQVAKLDKIMIDLVPASKQQAFIEAIKKGKAQ